MAVNVIMPKQGLQMIEGKILQWLVSEGSSVTKGQALFEIETDKVTITIDSPSDGTLIKIVKQEGETVPVSETVALIGKPGEAIDAALAAAPAAAVSETALKALKPVARGGAKRAVTPRARMRATERRIEVDSLSGSGPDGLVIERDVLASEGPAGTVKATHLAQRVASLNNINIASVKGSGPFGRTVKNDILNVLSARENDAQREPPVTQHLGRERRLDPAYLDAQDHLEANVGEPSSRGSGKPQS